MRKLIGIAKDLWTRSLFGVRWHLGACAFLLWAALGTPAEEYVANFVQYSLLGAFSVSLSYEYSVKLIEWCQRNGRVFDDDPIFFALVAVTVPLAILASYYTVRYVQEPRGAWVAVFTIFDVEALRSGIAIGMLAPALGATVALVKNYHRRGESAFRRDKRFTAKEKRVVVAIFAVPLILLLSPLVIGAGALVVLHFME